MEKDIFGIVRLDVTQTAQMVRNALKEAYPHSRFSVQCTRRASTWIDIAYREGPPAWEVERLIYPFIGRGELYVHAIVGLTIDRFVFIDDTLVHHGADHIHVWRGTLEIESSIVDVVPLQIAERTFTQEW